MFQNKNEIAMLKPSPFLHLIGLSELVHTYLTFTIKTTTTIEIYKSTV